MHLSISTCLYVTVKDSLFYLLPLINWQCIHLSLPLFLWLCSIHLSISTFSYITVLDAFISLPLVMWLCRMHLSISTSRTDQLLLINDPSKQMICVFAIFNSLLENLLENIQFLQDSGSHVQNWGSSSGRPSWPHFEATLMRFYMDSLIIYM